MNVLTSVTSTTYLGWKKSTLQIVAAQPTDSDTIVALFGALHSYNASLDTHFALADDWQALLRQEFSETCQRSDKLWLLVKNGCQAVGLLIAGIHTDSPMFKHRQWVEVEALYVADNHRCMGLAHALLNRAYSWAEANDMARVQLYVTASNERAQSIYAEQGFSITQAIMRKSLHLY